MHNCYLQYNSDMHQTALGYRRYQRGKAFLGFQHRPTNWIYSTYLSLSILSKFVYLTYLRWLSEDKRGPAQVTQQSVSGVWLIMLFITRLRSSNASISFFCLPIVRSTTDDSWGLNRLIITWQSVYSSNDSVSNIICALLNLLRVRYCKKSLHKAVIMCV